jgi:hypothetical protein
MDTAVHDLARRVPQPKVLPFKDSFVFRHVERLPQQAIVQKLSRVVSGLRAASTLCEAGLFQEQAAVQRMVDEIGEDILFLSVPLINNDLTDHHSRYLEIFFQEDFDPITGKPLEYSKPMVLRKHIRAYIAKHGGDDPSSHIKASKTVHKTDSGYIHAASPHIMDSYGGQPPHFHTGGMSGTAREEEYRWHVQNYFFRAVSSFAIAAKAFRLQGMHTEMMGLMKAWEKQLAVHRW